MITPPKQEKQKFMLGDTVLLQGQRHLVIEAKAELTSFIYRLSTMSKWVPQFAIDPLPPAFCKHIIAAIKDVDTGTEILFVPPISKYTRRLREVIRGRMLYSRDSSAFKFNKCPKCDRQIDWVNMDDSFKVRLVPNKPSKV